MTYRGRSMFCSPLLSIYEQKCRDNSLKVQSKQRNYFIKQRKESSEILHLNYQNIKSLRVIADSLDGYVQLNLSHNQLTNEELPLLGRQINKSTLIHVDLSYNNIKIKPLLECINNPTLISLNLSHIRMNTATIHTLVGLFKVLQFLWISNVQLTSQKYQIIKEALLESTLLYLDMSDNPTQLRSIPESQLLYLNIANNGITDMTYNMYQLEQLNISNNPLTNQYQLAKSTNKSQLLKLIMDNIQIQESFIDALNSHRLEYLSLQNCGLKYINKLILNNKNLRHLNASDNFYLEVPNLQIESLAVDRCFYDEKSLCKLFEQLYRNNRLRSISIKDTCLSLDVQYIIKSALAQNTQLQHLECNCQLDPSIQIRLNLNKRGQLKLTLNSLDVSTEFATIEQLTDKVNTKRSQVQDELDKQQNRVKEFNKQQLKDTEILREQYEQMRQLDLQLNKNISSIDQQYMTLIKNSEVDSVFYTNQIHKQNKQITEYKQRTTQVHQKQTQYKQQIQQLDQQLAIANYKLQQADAIYQQLLQQYNNELNRQSQIIQQQQVSTRSKSQRSQRKPRNKSNKSNKSN